MSFELKLKRLLGRHDELSMQLTQPLNPEELAKLSKEYSDLSPIVEEIKILLKAQNDLKDLELLLEESDPQMRQMARTEYEELKDTLPGLEQSVKFSLLPKDVDDERNAILEIRAGAGGDEAGIFAGDLLRMYQRYAQVRGWQWELLSISETGVGSIREASAVISGKGVFARLKFESGVHRVQRVPVTEASGRIHTSTATVAVLPEVEDVDIVVEEKDLVIDVYRASGAGGQHVNTTDSAVRITHVPTGIVVTQQDERSQHKNRAKALKILRSRLYEVERQRLEQERAASRKSQVGSGDRSERIRTYNFPQGRISDHRINLTLYKLAQVLEGNCLDEMIDALIVHHQAERLAEEDI